MSSNATPTAPRRSAGEAPVPLSPRVAEAVQHFLGVHLPGLRAEALAGQAGVAHAARVSRVYDGLAQALCAASFAVHKVDAAREGWALLAVGGYGRGLLGLGSDLDLVLLAPPDAQARAEAVSASMLYPLWDAGVSVGHAVRTAGEWLALAREDVRTATQFFDARLLAGDAETARSALSEGLRSVTETRLNRLLDALSEEALGRHQRYGASVYLLEPDLKHGRGSLRDLDLLRWALRARFGTTDFAAALRAGLLPAADAHALESAQECYWRLRGVLHARAKRRSDRLTFDAQEACAVALAFAADAADEAAVASGSERLMQEYYRHARAVATLLDRVLEASRQGRAGDRPPRAERLGEHLVRFDGGLTFDDADAPRRAPWLALRVVEVALHAGLGLSVRTRELLAELARDPAWCEQLRADARAGQCFLRLLDYREAVQLRRAGVPVSASEQGSSVLTELHDLGLLLALVPEFLPVTGRVHHDVYHVYTVDVHSLASHDRLHQIARGELGEAYTQARRALADVDRRAVLQLATLLHDVGKGRGGDHSALGSELARAIAARMGLGEEDVELVGWLVREHLTLYHYATRRDLTDPETVEALAQRMGDTLRLRALYLLTVADLSTTSPTAMTTWKARMLDELLARVEHALAGGARSPSRLLGQAEARVLTLAAEPERAVVQEVLRSLPERYLLAVEPTSALRHARLARSVPPGGCAVDVHPCSEARGDELLEVAVVGEDRPGFLARLAALLWANRLDVQSAQVFSRVAEDRVQAVDVFTVRRLEDDPGVLARIAARLSRELPEVLAGGEDLLDRYAERAASTSRFARPEPAVRTEVELQDDPSGRFTVLEVFARDRPGLLFSLARALFEANVSIALARVNTEGRRVADVFYVTEEQGGMLQPERRGALREALLRAARG